MSAVEIFDKFGFAGVIVAVLGWFMVRNEQILSKLNDTLAANNVILVRVCEKLGIEVK